MAGEAVPPSGPRRAPGIRLLCAADLHLGRQPSRLPAHLDGLADPSTLAPAAAWVRAVDLALGERVDAVLLAGDVVEHEDDFYEAYRDLHAGAKRLTEAGIPLIAVAGNHDLAVLPRLASALPEVILLGQGGKWETVTLQGSGGAIAHVVGWSFPQGVAAGRPFAQTFPERRPELTVGLLHCDRDVTGSRYAPVSSMELEESAVDTWLLGHVHRPDALARPRPGGYLGSISGMDPGEQGDRGVWLLEAPAGDGLTLRHMPLAPLRWEELDVAVDGLADPQDVHGRIVSAIEGLHRKLEKRELKPLAVGCRLLLRGRCGLGEQLRRELLSADPREQPLARGGISYFVHDWRVATLPELDLTALAQGGDPPGLLARQVLMLRSSPEDPERKALLRAAATRLEAVGRKRQFESLAVEPPGEEDVADLLEANALRALDALLAQRGARS